MNETDPQSFTAFIGDKILAQGELAKVALKVKRKLREDSSSSILIFSDSTGKEMDFDLRGSESDVLQRLQVYISQPEPANMGPGRPKLGVISREISLLPRHWEWLSTQSGGASATLRRLVDEARKQSSSKELVKQSQERAYKFMAAIAGNLPHYEEALRALFSGNKKRFEAQIKDWPKDIKQHSIDMAGAGFNKN